MSANGYADKSLVEKLGYKQDEAVCLINAPEAFVGYLQHVPCHIVPTLPADWLHAWFKKQIELERFLIHTDLTGIKGLWVSWPKRASRVLTDLTEQTFRDYLLPLGWVDTKVCSLDDTWSGLKFLRRKS